MDQLSPLVRYVSSRASLGIQWLRIHLPMQGTWVLSLVWEDPTRCRGLTQSSQLLSPCSRACKLRFWGCLLQLPKPRHLEPVLGNKRGHHKGKPMHYNGEECPCSPQVEKALQEQQRPSATKKQKQYFFKKKKCLFNCHGTQPKVTFLESCIIYTLI